jgi:hypothetical protein
VLIRHKEPSDIKMASLGGQTCWRRERGGRVLAGTSYVTPVVTQGRSSCFPTMSQRQSPIIVITGTPGTGKSTHAQLLANEAPVPLRHINIGDWVKEKGLYEDFDEDWQSYTVDEDKVRKILHTPFRS